MTDLNEIDRMTYREYRLRMKAYELKRLDSEYYIALLAWQIREINAKKKSGKNKLRYVYNSFRKFFDYAEQEEKILGITEREVRQKTTIDRYKDYMRARQWQDIM